MSGEWLMIRCPLCGFNHHARRFEKGVPWPFDPLFHRAFGLGRGRGFRTEQRRLTEAESATSELDLLHAMERSVKATQKQIAARIAQLTRRADSTPSAADHRT